MCKGGLITWWTYKRSLSVKPSGQAAAHRPGYSYFQNFIENALFTLTSGFTDQKRLQTFLKTLENELRELEYKETNRLAKVIRSIAKHRHEIVEELEEYQETLNNKGPRLRVFLKAMDNVYMPVHAMRFKNYNLVLQDYGRGDRLDVDEETRKILRDVIIGGILERPEKERKELHKKMKKAIKEL